MDTLTGDDGTSAAITGGSAGGFTDDGAHGFQQLHPAAPFIWRVVNVPITFAVGAAAVVIAALVAGDVAGGAITIGLAVVSLIGVIAAWWYPSHKYRHWRYRISAEALELRQGVWFRSTAAVPFHRIQQIDVEQGPLQRRHGVVTLRLRTAAALGTGTLPHLAAAEADVLRERLLVAARAAAAVDDGH